MDTRWSFVIEMKTKQTNIQKAISAHKELAHERALDFQEVWNNAENMDVVEYVFGLTRTQARVRARVLRKRGYELKNIPKQSVHPPVKPFSFEGE